MRRAPRRSGFRGIGGGTVLPDPPVISGDVEIGETLTAVGDAPLQWYRGGVAIGGETASTYVVVAADIRVTNASITCANPGGHSNALAFAADAYFPDSAIGLSIAGITTADSGATVDQWIATYGGKKANVVFDAPAATNRPAYDPTGGPGGVPTITGDGVDNVLRDTAIAAWGFSLGATRSDVYGFCNGAQTLGDILMRYVPASNAIDFGVTAAPAMRLMTSGTGGAVSSGTTTITVTIRLMTYEAISGASGSQTVAINNAAPEDTDAITHAAWADAAGLSIIGNAAGGQAAAVTMLGWAFTAIAGEAAPLSGPQEDHLKALFNNECGT